MRKLSLCADAKITANLPSTDNIVHGVMDMGGLKLTGIVIALTSFLFAQGYKVDEHQLGAYKGTDDAVRSVMSYCDAIDSAMQEQQPRVFAPLNSGSVMESTGLSWKEFGSGEQWNTAGKPAPIAFVWENGGSIVRVTIVSHPRRFQVRFGAYRRIDYCYGTDSKLTRIRAVWYAPTDCEFLFPCRLIIGHEFFLGGQGPAVTDWVFTADGVIQKLRNGKAVDDYFDPSNSLTVGDLKLRTSLDLPFDHPKSPR